MLKPTCSISEPQYHWLAAQLPMPRPKRGRKPLPNDELLGGILYVLKTGCRWQDIPATVCAHGPSSCWRRLNF